VWGARHADILTEEPGGRIVIDMRNFHSLIPTEPNDKFPYSLVVKTPES